MSGVIDCYGNDVGWGHWLVKLSAFEDGSFKLHPEDAYEITDIEFDDYCRKPFDDNAPSETVENLVYRHHYVAVNRGDFDKVAMSKAKIARAHRRAEEKKAEHLAKREAYLAATNKPRRPWWRVWA